DVLQITSTLLPIPTDPLVARCYFPCGTGPQQTSQDLTIAGFDEVAQVSADWNTPAKIVEPLDQLTPERTSRSIHQCETQRVQFGDRSVNGRRHIDVHRNPTWTAAAGRAQRRQRQESITLETFQQQPAFVIFQLAIGPFPIQPLTDGPSD